MMKLVDMLGLGSSEETLEGSSPSIRSNSTFLYIFSTLFLVGYSSSQNLASKFEIP